jgi:hypothetical protein
MTNQTISAQTAVTTAASEGETMMNQSSGKCAFGASWI